MTLLGTIARPERKNPEQPKVLDQQLAFWIQQLLFCYRRSKCGGFAKTLALYLIDGGARKRVIDVLCELGVCCSWSTAQSVEKRLVQHARAQAAKIGSKDNCMLTYDNFDFSIGRSREYLGNRKAFRSITTSIAVLGQKIPIEGLKQCMWRPLVPLRPEHVIVKASKLFKKEVRS